MLYNASPLVKRFDPTVTAGCIICANTRDKRHFLFYPDETKCQHWRNMCKECLNALIKSKCETSIPEKWFSCVDNRCQNRVTYTDMERVGRELPAFKAARDLMLKRFLSTSPNYISCLNTKCGLHFSIEGCHIEREGFIGFPVTCPYCSSSQCTTCQRPWHAKSVCSSELIVSTQKETSKLPSLGVKKCPSCSVPIEHYLGCNAMICTRCDAEFCWNCLVDYRLKRHGPECRRVEGYL